MNNDLKETIGIYTIQLNECFNYCQVLLLNSKFDCITIKRILNSEFENPYEYAKAVYEQLLKVIKG